MNPDIYSLYIDFCPVSVTTRQGKGQLIILVSGGGGAAEILIHHPK